MTTMPTGIVNCSIVYIHLDPNLDSNVLCNLRYLTEVKIDLENSTKDFYKIYTAIGMEGFCEKDLVIIK